MEVAGNVVVVTGGASGRGEALCRRFAAEGAKGIVVADVNEEFGKGPGCGDWRGGYRL